MRISDWSSDVCSSDLEMYSFRTKMVEEMGLELITHINPDGVAQDMNPFTYGSAKHTDVMKTEGLKQALDKYGFDAAFGDRTSAVTGKCVSVRVDLGGRRSIQQTHIHEQYQ